MGLKEQFGKLFLRGRDTSEFEKIADEHAIAFAKWIRKETYYEHLTKEFIYKRNVYKNEKELLEIFIHDVL